MHNNYNYSSLQTKITDELEILNFKFTTKCKFLSWKINALWLGLRTLFPFLPSILFYFLILKKKSLFFLQTCSIILTVMMNICCNRSFSCQFWHGNITQIVKNWKHWVRVQNLPVGQSFERATKVSVLHVGYMVSSRAALSNFATIVRHDYALKNLLPGATQNE